MEVVTIADPETIKLETELIKYVFCHEMINGDNRQILAKKLINFLDCITDRTIAKTIYALSLLRISTPHNLKVVLDELSRDPVVNRLRKAINAGLVDTISDMNPHYNQFNEYWSELHPTTNKKSKFYVPTPDLYIIVDLFEEYLADLIDERDAKIMKSKGDIFQKRLSRCIANAEKKERDRTELAKDSIGACYDCSRLITITMQMKRQCETIADRLYCKSCWSQRMSDGTVSKLMKQNGKKK